MKSSKKRTWITILLILAVCIAGAGIYLAESRKKSEEAVSDAEEIETDTVVYQGKKYRYNSDLELILFMGVDKSEPISLQNYAGKGGQADTLLLAVLDREQEKVQLVSVSRDTVTDVKIYDESGEYLATEHAQIALQYAYGTSAKRSIQMTKEAVANLLYEVPIRSYVSLNVEGIAPIVDAMGGVTLTIPADYTMIDPSFTQGSVLTLNGAQAEAYVRYRDQAVTGSNTQRMERQNEFLLALFQQLNHAGLKSQDGFQRIFDSAGDYLETDLTAKEMQRLSEYEFQTEIITLPGEMQAGTEHDEYVIDDEKLYDLVLKLFYKPID